MIRKLCWYIALLLSKIFNNEDCKILYFRKFGMKIGDRCKIYSNILPAEPFLVEIGDDVTISSEVAFCTHDNSIIKVDRCCPNLFGKISIGSNSFLGMRSTIMLGVTIPNNVIVAAGSVVTTSFQEENIIIGGNPAKIIGK